MKQKLLLMVLTLGMCSININAQKKTYHVEDDGFEWYGLYEYKNGENYDGAQDKFGNSIIPQQKDISVLYFNGFFRLTNIITQLKGVTDKQGNLIVPVEYETATPMGGDNFPIPYISVKKGDYEGVYDIYGKCIIPVNRQYKDIIQKDGENGERCVYYKCSDGIWDAKRMNKYTICDASGKVVFTTSKSYQSLFLIRDKASGKCALIVEDNNRCYFIDKEEKVLWNPNNIVNFSSWPIKIKTSVNGPWRRLTQAELNKILLSEDILKGNKEYFAHASEYPKQKIGKIGENNIMTETKIETTPTQKPEKDQKIIIEHPRDPIPVQEWQQCTNCGGAGKLGCTGCGGSGTIYIGDNLRKCHYCNGHGENRCTFCSGNGGKYITVYR